MNIADKYTHIHVQEMEVAAGEAAREPDRETARPECVCALSVRKIVRIHTPEFASV